jgi:hypothetical protein
MMDYPDYIGREAVRRLNEARPEGIKPWSLVDHGYRTEVIALCQLLTETGFKEPEPRDLVMARRIYGVVALWVHGADQQEYILSGDSDGTDVMNRIRALLREYAGEEA